MRFLAPSRVLLAVVCLLLPTASPAQAQPEMGWLGISISDVNEDLADRLGSIFGPAAGIGVQVVEVLKDGPAEAAQLARGDVIVRVDTQPVWDVRQLQRVVRSQPVNRRVVLTVLRGTSRVTVPVTVGPMPLPARAQLAGERFGFLVREVEDVDPARSASPTKVAIAFVEQGSSASRAGLQPLDTILRVNDQPVRDLESYAQAMWRSQGAVALVIERRDAPTPITVTLGVPR